MENSRNYFGIDFGTTCSAAVGQIMNETGDKQIIMGSTDDGQPIPSIVAIDKETGNVTCGKDVKENYNSYSETSYVIKSIKTILDDENFLLTVGDKKWKTVDIVAEIFKTIKNNIERNYDLQMDKAVVSIPVGFNNDKRKKLRIAAKKADIEIKDFVSEPTAAYVANREKIKSANKVLVFDWGGGTLDVTIINNEHDKITEISSTGLNKAGDYIDLMMAKKIHNLIAIEKGKMNVAFEDIPLNKQDEMKVMAEKAKCDFSDSDEASIFVLDYGELGHVRKTLTYDWFNGILTELVTEAMNVVNTTLRRAEMGEPSIDAVIMVGGSSQLRPIREAMKLKFGNKLIIPQDSSWNVGEGSAIVAAQEGKHFSSQNISIVLSDGALYPLLKKGEELLNWEKTITLGIVDTSSEARLIFSGNTDIDENDNKYYIIKVPSYRFLREAIWITASIDENLIFRVVAGSKNLPSYYNSEWIYEDLKTGFLMI